MVEFGGEKVVKKASLPLVLIFVLALGAAAWTVTHVERPLAGATYVGLALGCRLEIYDTRIQPRTTVAVACPGQDLIRVWPLPSVDRWVQVSLDQLRKQMDWGGFFQGVFQGLDLP
jgi:hypothetical protein